MNPLPPWLQPVRSTGDLFIDDVCRPEILADDLFPKHESIVGIARAMRQQESWTRPAWVVSHVRTRLGYGGEATANGMRHVLLRECAGEIECAK